METKRAEVCATMSGGIRANVPQRYASYMDDVVRKIVARGNDAEIRSSKDGIKIFEVSKKVAAIIPANDGK